MLLALAAGPAWPTMAPDSAKDSVADMAAAMRWLAPAWSPRQQAAGLGTPDDVIRLHIRGSTQSYTRAQLADAARAPDWWPGDHPPMPAVVERGNGKAMPCALCHLPNGAGEPQNAPLAGLSVAYLTAQLTAFRTGSRSNSHVMQLEAAHLSDPEVQAAVAYYAALPMPPGRIDVVETSRVPAMHTDYWMLLPTPLAGAQALDTRLIETPGDVEQMKRRNARAGYVAYVPTGSIARGKALAAGGASDYPACTSCHGSHLRGSAAPALAGRSPTYVTRQLVQFKLGGRGGPQSEAMQKIVSPLTLRDMISLAAYTATLKP